MEPIFSELAAAKINLALQILGKRGDGYHLLDSIVAFLSHGDRIEFRGETSSGTDVHLSIQGPFAQGLDAGEDNLVVRAARLFSQKTGISKSAHLLLHKETPVGAGLGGGSADAGAVLRLLNRVWQVDVPLAILSEWGAELGADVPACIHSSTVRMQGVGEQVSAVEGLPELPVLLVYPASPLWTPDVYKTLRAEDYSGELLFPFPDSATTWLPYLAEQKNDLQSPAFRLNRTVPHLLSILRQQEGCVLARMSGSGSACFALFMSETLCSLAARYIRRNNPEWWCREAHIL